MVSLCRCLGKCVVSLGKCVVSLGKCVVSLGKCVSLGKLVSVWLV